jgi:hypothetical protein
MTGDLFATPGGFDDSVNLLVEVGEECGPQPLLSLPGGPKPCEPHRGEPHRGGPQPGKLQRGEPQPGVSEKNSEFRQIFAVHL